jgi:hypothetical protein
MYFADKNKVNSIHHKFALDTAFLNIVCHNWNGHLNAEQQRALK